MNQSTEYIDNENGITKVTLIEPAKKQVVNRDFKGIWIPKDIWVDKNLTWVEKLFMVEIDSLDNESGCFASNKYFSEFFDLSTGRVSQIINDLIDKKYLSVKYEMNGKEVKKRVLKILNRYLENDDRVFRKSEEGYLENAKDNNTLINNTINNTADKSAYRQFTDCLMKYTEHIPNYQKIFSDPKERKNLSSLIKLFKTVEEFDTFLEKASKIEFIQEQKMLPSILISQKSRIELSGEIKITEEMIAFMTAFKTVFGYSFDWTEKRSAAFRAVEKYRIEKGQAWKGMMYDYQDGLEKMKMSASVENILKKDFVDKYGV